MKKLSIWTRYDRKGASSRLRYFQFAPYFEAAGFAVDYHRFFSDEYLEKLYSGSGRQFSALPVELLKRAAELRKLPPEALLLIEYELLPFIPFFIEKSFIGNRRYVLNFDDAVDLRYNKFFWLKNKYPQLISNAAGIIVANDELFQRFGKFNENIIKLPTVPPPQSAETEKFPELTIGWIGTPVTYTYLQQHTEILQKMREIADFELLVIASKNLPPIRGVRTRCVDWSADSEMSLLQKCHIGIMPLPDTGFARGKSAYKLIQYLTAGIPAIASPVGENCTVLKNGKTGFLAGDAQQWQNAFAELVSEEKRARFSTAISAEAKKYSVSRIAEQTIAFLNKLFF